MFEISEQSESVLIEGAKIRVIGVGGGGCNAVNTMIKSGLSGVEYIVANTDAQALNASFAPSKIQLGVELTKGLGAGANPEIGKKAALDEYEKLSEVLSDSDLVFITAGMGGGTGTGAAPIIAKLAKELGALTVGVVTKPFLFEGKKRMRQASAGIQTLEESVDSLITIPNQRLLYLAGESLSLIDTFKKADEVLLNAVRGISDLINTTGHINADFADVSTVMSNKGLALMGTGLCSGPDRAIKAATDAISSPLLEDISIDGATGIIINITGDDSMTMHEVNEAATLIMEAADEDAEVIFGSVVDESLEDHIKVTVVATGLGGGKEKRRAAAQMNTQTPRKERFYTPEEIDETFQRYDTPQKQEELASTRVSDGIQINQNHYTNNLNESPKEAERTAIFNQEETGPSSLTESIKEAAKKYQTSKKETEPLNPYHTYPPKNETSSMRPGTRMKNRATIAEKLGFINFDEEELDSPSYLRKEEKEETKGGTSLNRFHE